MKAISLHKSNSRLLRYFDSLTANPVFQLALQDPGEKQDKPGAPGSRRRDQTEKSSRGW